MSLPDPSAGLVPVGALVSRGERFACAPLRATLTANTCLLRQEAAQANPKMLASVCRNCALGRQVAARFPGGATVSEYIKPPKPPKAPKPSKSPRPAKPPALPKAPKPAPPRPPPPPPAPPEVVPPAPQPAVRMRCAWEGDGTRCDQPAAPGRRPADVELHGLCSQHRALVRANRPYARCAHPTGCATPPAYVTARTPEAERPLCHVHRKALRAAARALALPGPHRGRPRLDSRLARAIRAGTPTTADLRARALETWRLMRELTDLHGLRVAGDRLADLLSRSAPLPKPGRKLAT